MAGEQKRQYPVRLDVSQQGTARAAPANQTPYQRDVAAAQAVQAAQRQRQMVESALLTGSDTRPGAGALNRLWGYFTDTPAEAAQRTAAVSALDTFRKNNPVGGATAPVVAAAPQAASGAATGGVSMLPVAAPTVRTPQDMAAAAAMGILSRPHTIKEAQAAVGMIPQSKTPSAKDTLAGQYGTVLQGLLEMNQKAIAADLAAGKLNEKQAAEQEKSAVKEWQQGIGAILGSNPYNLALAGQLPQIED